MIIRHTDIEWAYPSVQLPPQAFKKQRRKGARAKGIAYERKVQTYLRKLWGYQYLPNPWIRYKLCSGSTHWCQPDGIHFDIKRGIVTIVEIKHSHTSGAYQQLWELYGPVLRHVWPIPLWRYQYLEVVRYYDPHTFFPGIHRLRKTIEDVAPGETGVLIWNPRRSLASRARS